MKKCLVIGHGVFEKEPFYKTIESFSKLDHQIDKIYQQLHRNYIDTHHIIQNLKNLSLTNEMWVLQDQYFLNKKSTKHYNNKYDLKKNAWIDQLIDKSIYENWDNTPLFDKWVSKSLQNINENKIYPFFDKLTEKLKNDSKGEIYFIFRKNNLNIVREMAEKWLDIISDFFNFNYKIDYDVGSVNLQDYYRSTEVIWAQKGFNSNSIKENIFIIHEGLNLNDQKKKSDNLTLLSTEINPSTLHLYNIEKRGKYYGTSE